MFEELAKDPYRIPYYLLAWSITAAVLWPMMFPWLRFAYRIWHGNKPIEEELADELWVRSGLASGAMTGAAVGFLVLDYVVVEGIDFPPGPVHIVIYLGFLALSAGIMYYFFFMEDFFQGLMLAVIYLYIPALLLFLMWLVIRSLPFMKYGLFSFIQSWLKDPAGTVTP